MRVKLTWTPPKTRVDGSVLAPTEIYGADIYDSFYGDVNPYHTVIGPVGTISTPPLVVGVHKFKVVTRDTRGHRSDDPDESAAVAAEKHADGTAEKPADGATPTTWTDPTVTPVTPVEPVKSVGAEEATIVVKGTLAKPSPVTDLVATVIPE